MQTPSTFHADDTTGQPRANVLRVTARYLGSRVDECGLDQVIVPKADEEAWEGTEIDVRRTVL
jgi:hypothetical protein